MKNKTIFIYVNQGFAVRYLLTSSILKTISEKVDRVVILSHNGDEEIFKKKFERQGVIVEKFRHEKYNSFFDSSSLLRLLVQFRAFILNGNYNTKTIDDFRNFIKGEIIESLRIIKTC